MSVESGVVRDAPYTFSTRFEDAPGTNPEELVGAAHAGCFSMALSGQLTTAGQPPERIETTATVTLEKQEAGFTVTAIHLDTVVKIPGGTDDVLQRCANNALAGCPISRLLNARMTMSARLET
jgi:osmotically inducible protein OsmC